MAGRGDFCGGSAILQFCRDQKCGAGALIRGQVEESEMTGVGCESGKRVDWELRVLTAPQLGSLLEAAGVPNTTNRHLS